MGQLRLRDALELLQNGTKPPVRITFDGKQITLIAGDPRRTHTQETRSTDLTGNWEMDIHHQSVQTMCAWLRQLVRGPDGQGDDLMGIAPFWGGGQEMVVFTVNGTNMAFPAISIISDDKDRKHAEDAKVDRFVADRRAFSTPVEIIDVRDYLQVTEALVRVVGWSVQEPVWTDLYPIEQATGLRGMELKGRWLEADVNCHARSAGDLYFRNIVLSSEEDLGVRRYG